MYLAGPRARPVEALAEEIAAAGGSAEVAEVDALDASAVEEHPPSPTRRGPSTCASPRSESPSAGSRALIDEVTGLIADGAGMTRQEIESAMAAGTLLGRLPALAELADLAAFLASDRAGAMTGSISNLSAGAIVD